MQASICGAACGQCPSREACGGCRETNGQPFGRACAVAACCRELGRASCSQCGTACRLKDPLIAEFNALGIPGMPEVTEVYVLRGDYINLPYTLPNGQTVKLLEDDKLYFGNQLEGRAGGRCFGIAADDTHLLVCAYGEGGSDPEILLYKKRTI